MRGIELYFLLTVCVVIVTCMPKERELFNDAAVIKRNFNSVFYEIERKRKFEKTEIFSSEINGEIEGENQDDQHVSLSYSKKLLEIFRDKLRMSIVRFRAKE